VRVHNSNNKPAAKPPVLTTSCSTRGV